MSSSNQVCRGAGCALVVLTLGQLAACGGGSGSGVGPPDDAAGAVDTLVLSLDSAEVIVGDTLRLTAVARNASGEPVPGVALAWTSSDPDVATVSSDGLVTAIDLGEAEIEVGLAGASQQAWIIRSELEVAGLQLRGRARAKMINVPELVITPGEQTVDVGAAVQYSATTTKKNGGPLRERPLIRWSSDEPSVATVDVAGKATALKEGTTRIRATVLVGLGHHSKSVLLRVSACGGITEVQEWDANVSIRYNVSHPVLHVTYNVVHTSSATAVLKRLPGPLPIWQGPGTGQASVNNSTVEPGFGVTWSEVGSGPISGLVPSIRLLVHPPSEEGESCEYHVRYQDDLTYKSLIVGGVSSNITSSLGIARSRQKGIGPRPGGGWRLAASNEPIPGRSIASVNPDPGDELPPLPIMNAYWPLTGIGLGLFAADIQQSIGTAELTYTLVAR